MTKPLNESNDVRLVRRALERDPEACDQFIRRMKCVALILDSLNSRKGSPFTSHDLEDLAQTTLNLVWTKLHTFEGHGALESWVYSFCAHQFMNELRSKRRRPEPVGEIPAEAKTMNSPVSEAIEHDFIHVALERLDEVPERIIRMKHFSAMKFEEIAVAIDMKTSTVKTHYYRGIQELRFFLRPHGQEGLA